MFIFLRDGFRRERRGWQHHVCCLLHGPAAGRFFQLLGSSCRGRDDYHEFATRICQEIVGVVQHYNELVLRAAQFCGCSLIM